MIHCHISKKSRETYTKDLSEAKHKIAGVIINPGSNKSNYSSKKETLSAS